MNNKISEEKLNNYYSFVKEKLNIGEQEINYIIDLTLENQNLINNYEEFFMKKYLYNYEILKDYINIKKLNFDELIIKLNQIKNKAHFYFEDIDKNVPYYASIIDYLENTSNILL